MPAGPRSGHREDNAIGECCAPGLAEHVPIPPGAGPTGSDRSAFAIGENPIQALSRCGCRHLQPLLPRGASGRGPSCYRTAAGRAADGRLPRELQIGIDSHGVLRV